MNVDPRITRIEQLQFEIECEGEECMDKVRRVTLTKRLEVLERYSVKHFGSIIISE